ncbi:MAG: hypothetical protein ACI4L7_04120 [Christensenellales bacterium]
MIIFKAVCSWCKIALKFSYKGDNERPVVQSGITDNQKREGLRPKGVLKKAC